MTGCPACGGGSFSRIRYPGASGHQGMLGFDTIALCGKCGLGVAEPRVKQSALDAFYASGGYWHATGTAPVQSMHARNQCLHRARFAAAYSPKADRIRALDVGAGEGWLGPALRTSIGARAVEYHCVEPDPHLRAVLKPGGPPHRGFASLAEVQGPYELVFLNQILEHVADPLAFLRSAASLICAGGLLYVESPHADYRFKPDVFPHTLFFTADSLRRVAERSGFETLACESFGRSTSRRSGLGDLAARAGYRIAVGSGANGLAQRFDDAYWDYSAREDGLWLRWIGRKPAD